MVGERLRRVRRERRLSLQQVAEQANISAATLSRIETDKQALDVSLLLRLAQILDCPAAVLVADADADQDLGSRIAKLDARSRSAVWRELASAARSRRTGERSAQPKQLAAQIDELLAQIDFIRAEIEAVRRRIKR